MGNVTRVLVLAPYPPLHTEASAAAWSATRAAALTGMSVAVVSSSARLGATERALIDAPAERAPGTGPQSSPTAPTRLTLSRTAETPPGHAVRRVDSAMSQLVGLALRTAEARQSELLVGWHLEPYGVATAYAARLAGLPYALVCSGSDGGGPVLDDDLRATYRAVLEGAAHVVAPGSADRMPLAALGLTPERWIPDRGIPLPTVSRAGASSATPLLPRLLEGFDYEAAYLREPVTLGKAIAALRPRPALLDESSPIVAVLGDVHPGSGHDPLVKVLRRLVATGTWDFRFLLTLAGDKRSLEEALARVNGGAGYAAGAGDSVGDALARRTVPVPTLHPALMPELLTQCDIVCCLDRPIGMAPRRPRLVREALAAGCAVLCSAEAAAASGIQRHLVSGKNCEIVSHPSDLPKLLTVVRRLVTDEQHRHALRIGARQLSSVLERSIGEWNPLWRLAAAQRRRSGYLPAPSEPASGHLDSRDARDAVT